MSITRISGSLLLFFFLAATAHGKDPGTIGATYPIAEKDALVEIEERAKKVDWEKVFDRKKMKKRIRDYRPNGMDPLPAAREDRVFTVDMTWTLDFDVPDGRGGILYPRGFRFNPLAYVFLPNVLVVIDGGDARQVEWFRTSPHAKDHRAMLLLAGGSYSAVMEKLKMPVFYANGKIVRRFQLKAVPAVIVQKGTVMEVREYALEGEGRKKKR